MAEFIGFFCDIFGYLLKFLYDIFKNYGVAMIVFSVITKLILLPINIKQQKTTQKTAKLQGKIKEIQIKYKNNPEQQNAEMMKLYKEENLSPFSGCLSGIVQIILLLAMFYLVSQPLTFMLKLPESERKAYEEQVGATDSYYKEIAVIKSNVLPEEYKINMDFLGIDLSNIPQENIKDIKTLIIPILYVITSFISIKYSMSYMNNKDKSKEENKEENNELDAAMQMNKSMSYFMPIMSVYIAIIAPLGLGLYWLVNNVLQLVQQVIINKVIAKQEEV